MKFSSYIRKFRWSVVKSYLRKGFLIYEEMRKYLTTYEEAVSHILNLIFFFIRAHVARKTAQNAPVPRLLYFCTARQERPDRDFFKVDFFGFFLFYVRYTTLLHLPPLRFHCVGGCWDRNKNCGYLVIDSQTL